MVNKAPNDNPSTPASAAVSEADWLALALAGTGAGTWRWQAAAQQLEADRRCCELLGAGEQAATLAWPVLEACIRRQDTPRLRACLDQPRDGPASLQLRLANGQGGALRLLARPAPGTGSDTSYGLLLGDPRGRLAQAFDRLQTDTRAVVGHDLRSPLSAIATGAEVLRQSGPPEIRESMVALISSSVEQAADLISVFGDYVKVRYGEGLKLRPRTDSFHGLVEETVRALRLTHPNRQIRVSVTGDGKIPLDRERMAGALRQLLESALRHADAEHPIVLEASRGATSMRFCARNVGPGMHEKDGDLDLKSGRDNRSALGLFVARAVVEAHNGSWVWCDGEEETEVCFDLPLVG